MKHKKFTKTQSWLYEQYIVNNKTREQIAIEADVSLATIKEYIRKWNIKRDKLQINRDDLLSYIDEGLTTLDIAKKYNCDECTIFRYYKRYNIEKRNKRIYEQYDDTNDEEIIRLYKEGKSSINIAKIFNMSSTSVQSHLKHNGIKLRNFSEMMWNFHNKEIPKDFLDYLKLYNLYIKSGISKSELARRYNCSIRIINEVLGKHNIIKIKLDKNINRLRKKLRTHFNILTPIVLKRDNYTCQLCGSHEKLHVHHIVPFKILFHNMLSNYPELDIEKDYNKLFIIGTQDKNLNDTDNLITYCKKCHMYKVHKFNQ